MKKKAATKTKTAASKTKKVKKLSKTQLKKAMGGGPMGWIMKNPYRN